MNKDAKIVPELTIITDIDDTVVKVNYKEAHRGWVLATPISSHLKPPDGLFFRRTDKIMQ
jgi:hypothetical protein